MTREVSLTVGDALERLADRLGTSVKEAMRSLERGEVDAIEELGLSGALLLEERQEGRGRALSEREFRRLPLRWRTSGRAEKIPRYAGILRFQGRDLVVTGSHSFSQPGSIYLDFPIGGVEMLELERLSSVRQVSRMQAAALTLAQRRPLTAALKVLGLRRRRVSQCRPLVYAVRKANEGEVVFEGTSEQIVVWILERAVEDAKAAAESDTDTGSEAPPPSTATETSEEGART